jgi:hypothetical protein
MGGRQGRARRPRPGGVLVSVAAHVEAAIWSMKIVSRD